MKNEDHTLKLFYQNLGKLFYAIACIDGTIEVDEINALKFTVEKEWKLTEDTFTIIDSFSWLHRDQDYNADTCFKSFLNFMNTNKTLFTESRKALIVKTANAVASSFSNRNKSELMLLAKLDIELKKI
jgi:archaellum biogenesis ATPase FlaH|tara:strand:- start:210687 stop:211070 length:384 start_codon:yes stop_codon:yes gene_type:complete